jgi:hypothetical protein
MPQIFTIWGVCLFSPLVILFLFIKSFSYLRAQIWAVIKQFSSEDVMAGSISFLFHIIGFGLLFTTLLGGWIVERRLRKEKDWDQKLYIGRISRSMGLLSPLASIIILLTGIGNIINLYGGSIGIWYTSGWLVAKIILFAFMLVNGAVFGPILIRRRTKLIHSIIDKTATEESVKTVTIISKNISTFYFVQFLLLFIVLYISIAGGGKHPGIF